MKEKKVTNLKEVKQRKDGNELEILNLFFEVFTGKSGHSEAIAKLRMNLQGTTSYETLLFIRHITESVEAKTYFEMKKEMEKNYEEAQKLLKPEERKPFLPLNVPEWDKLLNTATPLKLKKVKIHLSSIPKDTSEYLIEKLNKAKNVDHPDENMIAYLERQIDKEIARRLSESDLLILENYFDLLA